MWNEDITLINPTFGQDEFGNPIENETREVIQAIRKNIGRVEFYQASQAGIRPTYVFVVHVFEYNNEPFIEYNGQRYTVIRTYQVNDDELELTVERKVADE